MSMLAGRTDWRGRCGNRHREQGKGAVVAKQ
jgi:hypothetical protein